MLLQGFHAVYDFEARDHRKGPYAGDDGLELDNGDADTNNVDGETGLQGNSCFYIIKTAFTVNK